MTRSVTIINILLGIVVAALLAAIVANGLSRTLDVTTAAEKRQERCGPGTRRRENR